MGNGLSERYRFDPLADRLGKGSFGAVYRCFSAERQRHEALKLIERQAEWDDGQWEITRRLFEREMDAARRITSEHIVKVHEAGEVNATTLYLVMDLVPDSRTLTKVLRDERGAPVRLPVTRALHIGAQLAQALVDIHDADIAHRDLKPDNIGLVTRKGTIDFVKVLDFGMAKPMSGGAQTVTRFFPAIGTILYMPPEQADPKTKGTTDFRADLYSFGVILYEMLAGAYPLVPDEEHWLRDVLTKPPRPLADAWPDPERPEALDALVAECLEKQPDKRPQTAAKLLERLHDIERGGRTMRASAQLPAPAPAAPPAPAPVPAPVTQASIAAPVVPAPVVATPAIASPVVPAPVVAPATTVPPVTVAPSLKPPRSRVRLPVVVAVAALAVAGLWLAVRGRASPPAAEAPAPASKPESLPHMVSFGSFSLARTETTVAEYDACVAAGACKKPETGGYCNEGKSDRGLHPVNCVSWHDAHDYCAWAGKQSPDGKPWTLPAEREWTAAAYGSDGRQYPWGNEEPTCERAVFDDGNGNGCGRDSTWPVCSKGDPRGLCDMAGNVFEWVEDPWEPGSFPRVVRGGSFDGNAKILGASERFRFDPAERNDDFGFRCASHQ